MDEPTTFKNSYELSAENDIISEPQQNYITSEPQQNDITSEPQQNENIDYSDCFKQNESNERRESNLRQQSPQAYQQLHFFNLEQARQIMNLFRIDYQMRFDSFKSYFELGYFIIVFVLLITTREIVIIDVLWMIWYVLMGSCWQKSDYMKLIASALITIMTAHVFWIWLFYEPTLVNKLFLLLNLGQVCNLFRLVGVGGICCLGCCSLCIFATYLQTKIRNLRAQRDNERKQYIQTLRIQENEIIRQNDNFVDNNSSDDGIKLQQQRNFSQKPGLYKSYSGQRLHQKAQQQKDNQTQIKQCSICLEHTKHQIVLQCKHYFHRSCLQDWLKDRDTCPLCRAVLF